MLLKTESALPINHKYILLKHYTNRIGRLVLTFRKDADGTSKRDKTSSNHTKIIRAPLFEDALIIFKVTDQFIESLLVGCILYHQHLH